MFGPGWQNAALKQTHLKTTHDPGALGKGCASFQILAPKLQTFCRLPNFHTFFAQILTLEDRLSAKSKENWENYLTPNGFTAAPKKF